VEWKTSWVKTNNRKSENTDIEKENEFRATPQWRAWRHAPTKNSEVYPLLLGPE